MLHRFVFGVFLVLPSKEFLSFLFFFFFAVRSMNGGDVSSFDIWSGDECFQVLAYSLLTNCPDITITVEKKTKNAKFLLSCLLIVQCIELGTFALSSVVWFTTNGAVH